MSEPKFRVGEEVLVISAVINPGAFFEVVIVNRQEQKVTGAHKESLHLCPPGWVYEFFFGGKLRSAHERMLRKKHKPGDSFESIMNECKSKTGERV